jgi:hypothetical protein
MLTRKSTPAGKTRRLSAAVLGMLLCASTHTTTAAGDSADALSPGAQLYGYFREARGGAPLPPQRTANFDEIYRRSERPAHNCLDGGAVLPATATACVRGQPRVLAAQYRPVAGSTHGAPLDASLSDLLTRLHYAFGSDLGLSSDRVRQDESEVLLKNSDAFVRAKIPVTLGREWRGFVYADVGAADSALRWQGLAGIRGSHGVDVLGGWRHVTYHFNPGRGFDSLDFDGPFLGATLTW